MYVLISYLLIVVVTGAFYWFFRQQKNIWQPKKKLRLLTEGPLAALARWGFKPVYQAFSAELKGGAAKAPVAMVGSVRGYAVEVSFGWKDENYFVVRVFFEPPSRNYEALMQAWRNQQAQAKKWKFTKGFFKPFGLHCAPVYINATFFYVNSPPEPRELIAVAEQITAELRASFQAPLAYEAACQLANDVIKLSQRQTAARSQER